jgi:hypothetical protein
MRQLVRLQRSRNACLAALLATTLPASAIHVDPRGAGQVLLFPYYTVNDQQQTVFSVVNTTDKAKIVEVSFREAFNGRSVLRTDVVLSPHDTWTATIFEQDYLGSRVPALFVRDASCTVPTKSEWEGSAVGAGFQVFRPFDYYDGLSGDGGPVGDSRLREGYFHVVERAELTGNLAGAARAQACDVFANLREIAASPQVSPPGGGLRGSFAIIDVAQGTLLGGSATAIDAFSATPLLSESIDPRAFDALAAVNNGGSPVTAQLFVNGKFTELTFPPERAVDALAAVLMTETLSGDVSREAALGSSTDWVITAPTKRFHTDAARARTQLAPFSSLFNTVNPAGSCSPFAPRLFGREGTAVELIPESAYSSTPRTLPQFALCHATDTVSFYPDHGAYDLTSPVLGARVGTHVGDRRTTIEAGSLTLTLGSDGETHSFLPPGSAGPGLRGLPVIGFETTKYINGNVTPGVLANYTVARPLMSSTRCTDAAGNGIPCP